MLKTALFWLDQGVAPIPLVYKSKTPVVKWTEFRSRLPSEAMVNLWFEQPRNLALLTGWQNLAVIDFDSPEAYAAWLCWNLEQNPQVPDTYRVQSSRGVHLYYYFREPVRLSSLKGALFEVKCAGRLVTAPPSIHESGRPYTALDDPRNIRVVRPEEILNYFPVHFIRPAPLVPSRFAPTADPERVSCIGEIKAKVKILTFFPHAVQVDQEGRYWQTDCPFHGRHGNFWIDNVLNRCGCWAGCGNFDVIDLWGKMNNLGLAESIRDLARMI